MLMAPKLTVAQRKLAFKDWLSQKYDELWDKADKLLKANSPCGIKMKGGSIICRGCAEIGMGNPNELCCGGCKFHTIDGCQAEKPLSCKLWLCNTAASHLPRSVSCELAFLESEADKLGFITLRGDKTASMKKATRRWTLLSV